MRSPEDLIQNSVHLRPATDPPGDTPFRLSDFMGLPTAGYPMSVILNFRKDFPFSFVRDTDNYN